MGITWFKEICQSEKLAPNLYLMFVPELPLQILFFEIPYRKIMSGDLLEWQFCFQQQKIRLEFSRDLPAKLAAEGIKAATNSARK